MRRAFVLPLLAALVVTGCVSQPGAKLESAEVPFAPLDDLVHKLDQVLEARIPIAGGVTLHGTVYVPDVKGKAPVIMDMGPYYGDLNPDTNVYTADKAPNSLYWHFLQRGYAIALVSVRGTGQSGGCFMIGGAEERADAAAAVEWLAAQAWSDGNVAMTGVSYDGTTPWEAYVEAPPHLKAIVPVEGISDFYRYSFFEGVAVGGGAAFNTYYKALVDVAYANPAGVPGWLPQQPSNACAQQLDVFTQPYQTYRDGVHGPFWDERDQTARVANATAAALVVHGFKDFNVKLDNVQTLWASLPEPKRMLLGQWEHNIPWSNSYDKSLSFAEYNATVDAFLDEHLRGDSMASKRAWPGPVIAGDSAGGWHNLTAWPPVESVDRPLQLTSDEKLVAKADDGAFVIQPDQRELLPVGSPAPIPGGPRDWTFLSEPYAQTTLLMGDPWLNLTVSVDRAEGHLCAFLYDVHDDGTLELISEGFQNLATRTTRDQAQSVPTGQAMDVHVLMEGIAQSMRPGHRLGLYLTGSREDTNTPAVPLTTYTVTTGGAAGATLHLPVFEATA